MLEVRVEKIAKGRAVVFGLLLAALVTVGLLLAAGPAHAAPNVFTVDRSDDPASGGDACTTAVGDCSLRGALAKAHVTANNGSEPDEIRFNIPASIATGCVAATGVCTISPTDGLPFITDPVKIDGYTQPGASVNTDTGAGTNAALKIVISGARAPAFTDGLVLKNDAGGTTIRGLVINGFRSSGIRLENAFRGGNRIVGNFIGTDVNGTADVGNTGDGINVLSQSMFNTIGGPNPEDRNLISGNDSDGIRISTDGSLVQNNLIGTSRNGTDGLGNGLAGVVISSSEFGNQAGTEIRDNRIAFNGSDGIVIGGREARVLSNSVFSNADLGIDLAGGTENAARVTANDPGDADFGPNDLQNFPVLQSATTIAGRTTIRGNLDSTPNRRFTVQFFSSLAADPSGHGEGETFLGETTVETDASGNASFSFAKRPGVASGRAVTATATSVTDRNTSEFSNVVSANTPPTADDDAFTATEDAGLALLAPGVLAGDTDVDGDALTVADPRPVSGPSNGTLTLNANGSFSYIPKANFSGTDSFTYRATDGKTQSNIATVTITVNPANDEPVADADAFTTDEDATLNVPVPGVLAGDTDVDGDPLTVADPRPVSGPSNGTLTLNDDGSFSYTPGQDFNGTDSFTYRATDGTDESNTATVTITVNPVNEVPTADDDSFTTTEDTTLNVPAPGVLAGDADADGSALTAILDRVRPSNGTLTLAANGSFSYTPNANFSGTDSFTYRATDGTDVSNIAGVTIAVKPVNDAPTVSPVAPRPGAETKDRTPRIKAVARDLETNLSKSNVKLFLDGARVASSKFTYDRATDRLTYTPAVALSFARHAVKVVATDAQGRTTARQWNFTVVRAS